METAVFFDFDGLWFQEDWYVKKSTLGILGSIVSWDDAFTKWQKVKQKNPNLDLESCYMFPSMSWDQISKEESCNVTLPSVLWEIAFRHTLKNHDISLLTQAKNSYLLKFINLYSEIPKNLPKHRDPFENIKYVSLSDSIKKSNEEWISKKLNFLLDLLDSKKQNLYKKIFLYHTQKKYTNYIEKIRQEDKSRVLRLFPSYIAKVKGIS